ncbi:hypothetical protein RRG08_064110, partial [Elysia crispata]
QISALKISYSNKSSTSTECPESNIAEINKFTADISCPTEYPVTSVTLSGDVVILLCSLYISAGRNVALKQRAEQSSWLSIDLRDRWWAEYAVDGRIPNKTHNSSRLTCSHTALQDKSPWWQVSFTQPVEITRFLTENRRDCCQERLKNFSLTVYPVNDLYKPITYRGSDKVKPTYSVVPSPRISSPVTQVKITEGLNPERILTLCEVFIFGEIHCPSNRYGLRCERECNCVNQTRCFVHSGGCPSGCAPGYTGMDCSEECELGMYGIGCKQKCKATCGGDHNTCNQTDGTCTQGCDPGYTGRFCQSMCPRRRYGHLCAETCSDHCSGADNTCNYVNGSCDRGCDVGYLLPLCNDTCPRGQYGPGCAEKCSDHCTGPAGECDFRTGVCYQGCEPGFQPPTCHKECPAGTYGPDCGKACSVHCADSDHICNKTDGSCDQGCKPGYQGRSCSETCRIGKHGPGCNTTCSGQCVGQHNPCHHIDGSCYLGCVQDDQSPMCRRTRGLGQKTSNILVPLVVAAVITAAAAVLLGLLVWRALLL